MHVLEGAGIQIFDEYTQFWTYPNQSYWDMIEYDSRTSKQWLTNIVNIINLFYILVFVFNSLWE